MKRRSDERVARAPSAGRLPAGDPRGTGARKAGGGGGRALPGWLAGARVVVVRLAIGLAAAAAVLALAVALLGGNPAAALPAFLRGAFGSPDSLAETLIQSTPLLFCGLGVAVAFRSGLWNIGAEGQLLMGMLASAATALALPAGLPPAAAIALCLAAGALAGAVWAGIAIALRLGRDVPEVIGTLMLNFLAVYLIEYLVRGPMKDPMSASDWSRALPEAFRLPRLAALPEAWRGWLPPELGRLHLGVALAALAALGVGLWLARTGSGFRLRVVGLQPEAAAVAGISLPRVAVQAFLVSGALAGLGGAVEQLAMIARLHRYLPGEPGYGFSGIAVALLGDLHPAGTALAALFFGALRAGSDQMQRSAGISFQVAYVVQAALILLLGAGLLRRRRSG